MGISPNDDFRPGHSPPDPSLEIVHPHQGMGVAGRGRPAYVMYSPAGENSYG